MKNVHFNPTPDQTFELVGSGPWDFAKALAHARELQSRGDVEWACDCRYKAAQRLVEVLPEDEEVNLEWNHRNSRAALEILHDSAIDHFLISDFEMSAAQLELLLECDPEDHLGACELLAYNYAAMGEEDSFDEVIVDVDERSASRALLSLWAEFRRTGSIAAASLAAFRRAYAPYLREFTAAEHPADAAYLTDIESEHPSVAAQARELWLRTEHLWTSRADFLVALRG